MGIFIGICIGVVIGVIGGIALVCILSKFAIRFPW